MEKKTYYVNIAAGEISQIPYDNNDEFIIQATQEEVSMLRAHLNNMHDASVDAFWRAHVPIKPYHEDQPNDDYDSNMVKVYQMLHDWGDEAARTHIESIGILK
ncbi:hydrolase [Lentibacillus sediminis]|uniref:hydrolase n=1 Tax=Lentibacillus sediminis TaxID=1940529 RepID=UPI000C1C1076|nr:hydrolase [Lentibacillus sediminis]